MVWSRPDIIFAANLDHELLVYQLSAFGGFPIARLMPNLHLWTLRPDFIKMTDNRLGFGKKLIWTADETLKSGADAL